MVRVGFSLRILSILFQILYIFNILIKRFLNGNNTNQFLKIELYIKFINKKFSCKQIDSYSSGNHCNCLWVSDLNWGIYDTKSTPHNETPISLGFVPNFVITA